MTDETFCYVRKLGWVFGDISQTFGEIHQNSMTFAREILIIYGG